MERNLRANELLFLSISPIYSKTNIVGKYSIKDIENLSGIKAHTLRIWEQRYKLVQPKRTDTNIRYYTDEQLIYLLNICALNKNGYKISRIAKMNQQEIKTKANQIDSGAGKYEKQVNDLVVAMIELDEAKFEKSIATNILQMGFEKTMFNVVHPFLIKIGSLWCTGAITPAEEHFVTNLIRQKLIVAIDGQIVQPTPESKKFVLYLPEGELHELGLLFWQHIIKARNHIAIYLGTSLPLESLKSIINKHQPDYICSMVTVKPYNFETLADYVQAVADNAPKTGVLLSGKQIVDANLDLPNGVTVFSSIEESIKFIESM